MPDHANASGLKIQLLQQPGHLRPPILSVFTRYLLAGAERDFRKADTTLLLFRGDTAERQERHHAAALAQVHTIYGWVIKGLVPRRYLGHIRLPG